MKVEIISPSATLFAGEATAVTVPSNFPSRRLKSTSAALTANAPATTVSILDNAGATRRTMICASTRPAKISRSWFLTWRGCYKNNIPAKRRTPRYMNQYSVESTCYCMSMHTLCYPMSHSTSGLPAHHQLPEFTQTHLHRVSDAIQPSYPLSSPSPPAPNQSEHQSLFQ